LKVFSRSEQLGFSLALSLRHLALSSPFFGQVEPWRDRFFTFVFLQMPGRIRLIFA